MSHCRLKCILYEGVIKQYVVSIMYTNMEHKVELYIPSSRNTQSAKGGYVSLVLLGSNGLKNVLFSVIGIINLSQYVGITSGIGSGGFLLLRCEDNAVFAVFGATENNKKRKIILFLLFQNAKLNTVLSVI